MLGDDEHQAKQLLSSLPSVRRQQRQIVEAAFPRESQVPETPIQQGLHCQPAPVSGSVGFGALRVQGPLTTMQS